MHSLELYKWHIKISKYQEITVKTDSQYSIDSITKWAYNWQRQGWKRKKKEVKNLELIKRIFNLYNVIEIR